MTVGSFGACRRCITLVAEVGHLFSGRTTMVVAKSAVIVASGAIYRIRNTAIKWRSIVVSGTVALVRVSVTVSRGGRCLSS